MRFLKLSFVICFCERYLLESCQLEIMIILKHKKRLDSGLRRDNFFLERVKNIISSNEKLMV